MTEYTATVDGKPQTASVSDVSQRAAVDDPQHTVTVAPVAEPTETGPAIVDDFEDGDLAEYTGDTALFVVDSTAPVPNGSLSLKTDAGGTTALIVSTAGLDNYLNQGETMAVQLHPVAGNDSRMGVPFFVQDANNFYMTAMAVDQNNFQIFRQVDGGFSLLVKVNVSLSQGTEYRVEITPQADGTLLNELFEEATGTKLASMSATDTTYSDGGNGWRIASGNSGSTGDAYDYGRLI